VEVLRGSRTQADALARAAVPPAPRARS
jgi:hypothetical protein